MQKALLLQITRLVLTLLGLALIASRAIGCSEAYWQWSDEDWIKSPRLIYVGRVVAVSASSEYIHDGEKNDLADLIGNRGVSRIITLKVYETLRGSKERIVHAELKECSGDVPEFLDEIVLLRVGDLWIAKEALNNPTAAAVVKALSARAH